MWYGDGSLTIIGIQDDGLGLRSNRFPRVSEPSDSVFAFQLVGGDLCRMGVEVREPGVFRQ